MKKIVIVGLLSFCGIASAETIQIPDEGKIVTFSGTVTKVLSTPEKNFKAHYLKLSSSKTFDDGNLCGEITQNQIALNEFNLGKFVNKKVSVTGTLFCQQQYTGVYHLQGIKVKLLTP